MPNQRSPNKVRLGGFVSRKLYRAMVGLAKRSAMGKDKFGFTQQLVLEALEQHEQRSRKGVPAPRRNRGTPGRLRLGKTLYAKPTLKGQNLSRRLHR